jgi:hypothetical protein
MRFGFRAALVLAVLVYAAARVLWPARLAEAPAQD